jgi:hypothetical protein
VTSIKSDRDRHGDVRDRRIGDATGIAHRDATHRDSTATSAHAKSNATAT